MKRSAKAAFPTSPTAIQKPDSPQSTRSPPGPWHARVERGAGGGPADGRGRVPGLASGSPCAARSEMPSPLTDASVLDALRPIVDPDFGKSIVDLGFVKNI